MVVDGFYNTQSCCFIFSYVAEKDPQISASIFLLLMETRLHPSALHICLPNVLSKLGVVKRVTQQRDLLLHSSLCIFTIHQTTDPAEEMLV